MQADLTVRLPETYRPLEVPVPPMLEAALDYPAFTSENARWLSFYWSPFGDEAMFDDGRTSGTGDWQGYLVFVDYPAVRSALGPEHSKLGSSGSVNTRRLLLDRLERKIYLVEDREACLLLSWQWQAAFKINESGASDFEFPASTGSRPSAPLFEEWLRDWEEVEPPPLPVVMNRLQLRQQIISAMFHWLSVHSSSFEAGENHPDFYPPLN